MVSPTWMNVYAPVTPNHAAAAANGKAWVVDAVYGNLYYYDNVNYVWVAVTIPAAGKILSCVSAALDGSVVGVCTDGSHYLYSGGSWAELYISSNSVTTATIGDVNDIVVVDSTGAVIKDVCTVITSLPTGPIQVSATASLAEIWGVNASNSVLRYNYTTNSWTTITGKSLVQVHVSMSSSNTLQVFGVDALGKGWSYNTSTSTWSSILTIAPGTFFKTIEGGAGYVWAVTTLGVVYTGYI